MSTEVRRKVALALGAATLAAAFASGGCEDGAKLFEQLLEPPPVIPRAEEAATSPIHAFASSTVGLFADPGGGYAAGPFGLSFATVDDEELSPQTSAEESDAIVCDPANDRVVLLKARAHSQGLPPQALDFAIGADVGGASAALFVDNVGGRRIVIATTDGYTVLDQDGAVVGTPNAIAGGPFRLVEISEDQGALFLVATTTITRIALVSDQSGDLAPASAGEVLFTASSTIGGIEMGEQDQLFFTDGTDLRSFAGATGIDPNDVIVLDSYSVAGGETLTGLVLNSEGNVLVGVNVGGATGRIDEVDPQLGAGSNPVSMLALPEPVRQVAIDGLHSTIYWTGALGVNAQLEPAPTLTDRIYPIFENRACVGCHPVVNAQFDLTNEQTANDTLVGQPSTCDPGAGFLLLVSPGNAAESFLWLKLDAPPCGVRMPQNLRPAVGVEIEQTRLWIQAGAPQGSAGAGGPGGHGGHGTP